MPNDIIVKKSKISGKGIFTNRDFKKGEVVLKWNPKTIKKSDIKKLSKKERGYVAEIDNKYYLMQEPERYVNHSCELNTEAKNNCDVAIRDIKKGEEITTDYGNIGNLDNFRCRCGSKSCRNIIF